MQVIMLPSFVLMTFLSIVRMPYMSSNIPSTIVYSALVGEFLRIGRTTLKLQHFTPKAEELLDRMIAQGAKVSISKKKILKIMSDHPEDFSQFKTEHNTLVENLFLKYRN